MQTPTVFVVDDDKAVRSALELLIESAELKVKSYVSATDFLRAYSPHWPGCLVLDVRMPDMTGLELQEELNHQGITLPILFITGHGDVPMSVKAFKGGAQDFIEKPFDDQMFLDRVIEAIEKDAEARKKRAEAENILRCYNQLTSREQEIMAMVIDGKSSRQIADQLVLSPRTIEVHRARVMDKMEAESLSELIAMAVTVGLHGL